MISSSLAGQNISNKKINSTSTDNLLLSSSILNPNLLDIDGPDVTLIFKQAKAKKFLNT